MSPAWCFARLMPGPNVFSSSDSTSYALAISLNFFSAPAFLLTSGLNLSASAKGPASHKPTAQYGFVESNSSSSVRTSG